MPKKDPPELSSLAGISDAIDRAGKLRAKEFKSARLLLKAIDEEIPLSPLAEDLCQLVQDHDNAFNKLAGLTSPPKTAADLYSYGTLLKAYRRKLNDIAKKIAK